MGYFLTVLINIGQNTLMGVGIHKVFSVGGIFFLGFPTVVNVSAYTLAIAQREGLAPALSFLLAIVAALLVSWLFAYLFMKMSEDSFVVLGLASIVAFEALALSWGEVTNGALGIKGIARPEFMKSLMALTIGVLVLAVLLLIVERVLLSSWLGRAARAAKEDPQAVETLGISYNKMSSFLIVFSGFLFGLGATTLVWQVQFLDPSFAGLPLMIEVLTIGILALQPKLRYLMGGVLFVVLVPELMRFLSLPSELMGQLRVLIYAGTLMLLTYLLRDKLTFFKRSV